MGDHSALQSIVSALGQRMTSAESQLSELAEWRTSLAASTLADQVVEANVEAEVVPTTMASVDYYFPFVRSIRATCHKVVVGYPEHPRHWRAKCGWQFGFSEVARPTNGAADVPQSHLR